MDYRYCLDETCCEFLCGLPPRSRKKLIGFFRRLTQNPFMRGDYQEADAVGTPLEVMLVEDEILVTWHADHAVKRILIVGLERV
jgi:hypothetical protein